MIGPLMNKRSAGTRQAESRAESRGASRDPSQGKRYWLYGWHAAMQALRNEQRVVMRCVVTANAAARFAPAELRHIKPETLEPAELERLLPPGSVHQGIALLVEPLDAPDIGDIAASKAPILVLDQVEDPHNVGAVLRSASAFGAAAIITQDRHSPPESATVAKAASGGLDIVPWVRVPNLAQALETLKKAEYWCVGLDGEAKETVASAKLSKKTALVLGAEGKGLRRLTAERCDLLVRIPMAPAMESLNVSNAAAIGLYQLFVD